MVHSSTVRESRLGFGDYSFFILDGIFILSISIAELFQHLYKIRYHCKWELCKLILVTYAAFSVPKWFSDQWCKF